MSSQTDTGARAPWLAILALGLVALALLFAAQPSQAVEVAGVPVTVPAVGLAESEDEPFEEDEDEECEEFEGESADEEVELEEECEELEEDEGLGVPPSECRLRTASARVFTHASDRLSLVVGYTAFSPANATVSYRLRGSKGRLNLGRTRRHLSRQGVFKIDSKLNKAQLAKVMAATAFEVRIEIAATPGYCRSYYTRHLEAKRKRHGQVVWSQAR